MPIVIKKKMKKVKPVRVSAAATQREVTRLGSALRALGGFAGGSIGSMVGTPGAGATAGSALGAALSKWLGSGDYTVSSNSIVQRVARGSDAIPGMHSNGQTVLIRHKEYLGEIRGSQTFAVQRQLDINPGNTQVFPWLSSIAAQFQEYRLKGMVYHYVPSSGNAVSSTNPALGTVMMQTSYRSNDSTPVSKVELLNEYWASESIPSEPFCHPIECDPKENPFNVQYVRTGSVPTGDSVLLYDLGRTYIATSGQQVDGAVLGDLWVTYEVELKKPMVESNVTGKHESRSISWTGGTMVSGNYFNGSIGVWGALPVTATGKTISIGPGTVGAYLGIVTLSPTTTFSACDLSGGPTCTNCTAIDFLPSAGTTSYLRNVLGGSSPTLNRAFYVFCVQINDPAATATVVLPDGTFTGACTESSLCITPINLRVT